MTSDRETKISASCGREMEDVIMDLLDQRAPSATICPSDAARLVGGDDWRELMEPARSAARRLQAAERVRILKGGRPVDPSRARGPIRIGRFRRQT